MDRQASEADFGRHQPCPKRIERVSEKNFLMYCTSNLKGEGDRATRASDLQGAHLINPMEPVA